MELQTVHSKLAEPKYTVPSRGTETEYFSNCPGRNLAQVSLEVNILITSSGRR